MMYSKSLKFSIVLRLFLCNRPTFLSGSRLSVYKVSLVFRQKVRGAVDLIFCNINVNLFLSPDKCKTLPGNTLLCMEIVQSGNERKESVLSLRGRA